MKVRDVPVPRKLRSRPRDARGFPIPYTVLVVDGVPDFRVNDEQRREEMARLRLCALCGNSLDPGYVFIGGPQSAESGAYFDGPLHEACARYARAVCPYLAFSGRDYREGEYPAGFEDVVYIQDVGGLKPDHFVMVWTRSFRRVPQPNGSWVFLATSIYRRESWTPA